MADGSAGGVDDVDVDAGRQGQLSIRPPGHAAIACGDEERPGSRVGQIGDEHGRGLVRVLERIGQDGEEAAVAGDRIDADGSLMEVAREAPEGRQAGDGSPSSARPDELDEERGRWAVRDGRDDDHLVRPPDGTTRLRRDARSRADGG